MKKTNTVVASLIAGAAMMLAALPGTAATVDVNIGVPTVVTQPVYVTPRPVYVQPQYEVDWRARQERAAAWRADPRNHGQVVSAAAHARNDDRKHNKKYKKIKKHHKNKHGH